MASTTSLPGVPPGLYSVTFVPFATTMRVADFAISAASVAPSFLLAETVSFDSMLWSSKNLDARVQDPQPLRW